MSAIMIDGKRVAAETRARAAEEAAQLIRRGVTPHLAVVLAGDNPASQTYVRNKERACHEAGFRSTILRLPADCTQAELEEAVLRLNADASVHGILVQLPLPAGLDAARVLALIDPDKDVDGFHAVNAGRLATGQPGFVPCTPLGVIALLDAYQIPIAGSRAVVIGRSNIVGKPMARLLLARDATVTMCHSGTRDLASVTREADILIAAVGRPGFVTPEMVKPGAAVIDVGISRTESGLAGDVAPQVAQVAGYLTPVPGGVGPMTVAMLLHNTLQAARRLAL